MNPLRAQPSGTDDRTANDSEPQPLAAARDAGPRRIGRVPRRALLRLGLLAVAAPVYATAVEPDWIRFRRLRLPASPHAAGRPVRWAHFTDVHYKGNRDRLDRAVDRINAAAPDFACFTGDLIEEAPHLEGALDGIRRLQCPAFGIPGNHDHWAGADFSRCRRAFAETGGAWLMDADRSLSGLPVHLIGLDRPDAPLRPVPDRFNLVLMHYPAWARELAFRADLMLAGHSHGGQVRLPGIGAVIEPQGTAGYDLGWFETPSGPLYVNPGIGTFHLDVRLNCRPEVTLFELGS